MPEESQFIDAPGVIAIGDASREGGAVMVLGPRHERTWHGMEVEALLSLGFIKHHVWTIDFDRREWFLTPFQRKDSEASSLHAVNPEHAAEYTGDYEVAPGVLLKITQEEGTLYLQAPGQNRVPLTPEAEDSFSIKLANAQIRFARATSGAVTELVLVQGGRETRAGKIDR